MPAPYVDPGTPTPDDVDLGTILGVWAHPDDEAYLSAGLMVQAGAAGRRAVCATATAGELGFPDDDPRGTAERAELRRQEMAACLGILGVTEHHWLDYPDGGCADVPVAEGADRVGALIDAVRPDTLLTFAPDGATGHPDHIAVSRWSTVAVRAFGSGAPRLLYATHTVDWVDHFFSVIDVSVIMMVPDMKPEAYSPDELDVLLRVDGELLERKVRALHAQASQVEPLVEMLGLEQLRHAAAEEAFRAPRAHDPPW